MRATINGRTAARTSFVAALLMIFGPGCAGSDGEAGERTGENAQALNGPVSFLSADDFPEVYGEEEEEEEEEEEADGQKSLEEDDREIGQGDIYRVLGDGYLLNLNVYRGLQVINIQNPAAPAIVARLPLNGTPFDVHVRNNRAVVLVNDWYGYKADANKIAAQRFSGGALLEVDITNRAAPQIVAEHNVPGFIRTAERYSDSTTDTLYIAAVQDGRLYVKPSGEQVARQGTALESFELTSSGVVAKSELLLDGQVAAMTASSTGLLVSRTPVHYWGQAKLVSIIDISGANGAMTLRGSVTAAEGVRSPLYMDLRNDQLRLLTGPSYSGNPSKSCRLQTWDVSNPDSPVSVDVEDFSAGRVLNGATFLDDRAFVTTTSYGGDGAFHAFSIDPSGNIDEKNESTAPFKQHLSLRPVLGGSRLIGIEVDGPTLAVGLYDGANLTNPNPLLVQSKSQWTTGFWGGGHNQKPFWYTMLENAVSVQAPTGETETGLVLLPFRGDDWSTGQNVNQSGVEIFTFSSTTVTRRGFLPHQDSDVQRVFRADASTGVTLSDSELNLHDMTSLDSPAKQGYLALAPDNLALLRFGNHRVRVRKREEAGNPSSAIKPAAAEVIAAVGNVEAAAPLASIDVRTGADYFKVGNLLVVSWPRFVPSEIEVYDFSDPLHPQSVSKTGVSMPSPGYGPKPAVHVTNKSLAFVSTEQFVSYVGNYQACVWRPLEESSSCLGQEGCTYWVGDRWCHTPDGGQQYCSGGFAQCTDHVGAEPTCVPVPFNQAQPYLIGGCDLGPGYRSYKRFTVRVIDLSNPAGATVLPAITLPSGEEAVSALSDGDDLFLTVKEPAVSPTDPRPHSKYSIRRIDLSQPSQPVIAAAINVPGELLAIDGDTIITRDRVWGDFRFPDAAVAKLKLKNGLAVLHNYEHIADREVASIVVDDNHRPVVTHSQAWKPNWWNTVGSGWDPRPKVTIMKPEGGIGVNGFKVIADKPIQPWMNLVGASQQRIFFAVPGGTLVVDADKPKKLKAQAFFFAPDILNEVQFDRRILPQIDGNDILLVSGRVGIHQLDLTSTNLP